jgi:hypothetical protein
MLVRVIVSPVMLVRVVSVVVWGVVDIEVSETVVPEVVVPEVVDREVLVSVVVVIGDTWMAMQRPLYSLIPLLPGVFDV